MSTPRSQRSDTLDSTSSLNPFATPARGAGGGSNNYSNDGPGSILSSTLNPTHASFSPATLSATNPSATSAAKRRSTILVHQKSPLLLATPPQITRALAYSHPFLLPLNQAAGLLSWTSGDPWQSFLLVVIFWAAVLYGDIAVRFAGPVLLVVLLIGGMYGRRFSPLSSSGWAEPGLGFGDGSSIKGDGKGNKKTGKGKNLSVEGLSDKNVKGGVPTTPATGPQRNPKSISEITNTRHQKTLDEMVETLKEFTGRCNILLEPLLELTDFLSTQRTPTSATTRPALTTLFVRILLCTPFWFALTLSPWRIITTRRVFLVFGTILLTWHARPMRVCRAILWRSASVRRLMALITGLEFEGPLKPTSVTANGAKPATPEEDGTIAGAKTNKASIKVKGPRKSELTKALRRARGGPGTGVRFTFIIYENQRRWVGLGWTTSLFAYERPAWTDEHNNLVPPRDQFELPDVEDGSNMRWRWVEGSRWKVDGVPDEAVAVAQSESEDDEAPKGWDYDGPGGRMGWVYYDNKWQNGRRGADGWGRWTRRRKWYRDAELVEADEDDEETSVKESTPKTPEPINTNVVITEPYSPTPTPTLPPRIDLSTPNGNANGAAPYTLPEAVLNAGHNGKSKDSIKDNKAKDNDKDEEFDSASLLSSSSRSTGARSTNTNNTGRFKPSSPSLRRRVTGSSHKSRRASGSHHDEDLDTAALGTQVGLAIQDAAKEGGSWGVGDEVRMGLD